MSLGPICVGEGLIHFRVTFWADVMGSLVSRPSRTFCRSLLKVCATLGPDSALVVLTLSSKTNASVFLPDTTVCRLWQIMMSTWSRCYSQPCCCILLFRLDYCNTLLAPLPYTFMAPLQRVILIRATCLQSAITRTRHTSINWITLAPDRGSSAIQSVPPRTLSNTIGKAPDYISNLLQPISGLWLVAQW